MTEATIGNLARQAGVNIETVRYYERRGLLPRPTRNASNYRIYDTGAIRRVRFIKRAQSLGFSLREIETLLSLRASPRAKRAGVKAYAEARIQEIEVKVCSLESIQKALKSFTVEYSGKKPPTQSQFLDYLELDDL